MSKRKELKEVNAKILKSIDNSFDGIKNMVEYVPRLEERKMEAQAFDILIDNASDVEIEEMYGKLLPMRRQDEQNFSFLSSKIGEANNLFNGVYINTSGTTSTSTEIVFSYRHVSLEPYTVSEPVRRVYKELAEYKSRKVEIPKGLSRLQPDLGRMFSMVHNTVDW